jgi:hypothetical protein
LDVRLSVTNTLPDTLAFVGVSCVSFTNSALTLLQLDRDFALPAGSSTLLCPGSVADYHATYTLRAEDLDDERELICSVLVEGRTESGEWVIAHEDDLIRLARSGLESAS